MRPLTVKERRFVEEYLASDGNATEAAMQAYDCADRASGAALGYQLLKRSEVRAALGERLRESEHDLVRDRGARLAFLAGMAEDHTASDTARLRAVELLAKIGQDFDGPTMKSEDEFAKHAVEQYVAGLVESLDSETFTVLQEILFTHAAKVKQSQERSGGVQ